MALSKDELFRKIKERIEKDGNEYKAGVPAKEMLEYVYGDRLPDGDMKFKDIKKTLKEETIAIYEEYINKPLDKRVIRKPVDNSFNNCNGRWTEYVFDVFAWNKLSEINKALGSDECFVYVKLPSRSETFWSSLLGEKPKKEIESKEADLGEIGAKLESSNPDAVILRLKKEECSKSWDPCVPLKDLSLKSQEIINSVYKACEGKVVLAKQLVAFLSVKSSTRADRRYQWIVEGNSTKGLYAVAFRKENRDRTLSAQMRDKFFAFSFDEEKEADKKALSDLIMFASLFNEEAIGITYAIDGLYSCVTPNQVTAKIEEICKKHI